MNYKRIVWGSLVAAILVGCTQSTSPRRDDTTCRSGISISSGDKCGGE